MGAAGAPGVGEISGFDAKLGCCHCKGKRSSNAVLMLFFFYSINKISTSLHVLLIQMVSVLPNVVKK